MSEKLRKLWKEFIPFLIVYVIIDIIIVGSLFVCVHEAKSTGESVITGIFSNFVTTLTHFKFFTAFVIDFIGFIKWSFWSLVITIAFYIVWKSKFTETSEYKGIESGSSDWARHGEEFAKTSDGREILNRKSGFILSKDHYLGTDLKKVLINKNVLVIGRIRCG